MKQRTNYESRYNSSVSRLSEAPSEDRNAVDIDVQTWIVYRNDWEVFTSFTEKGANEVAKFLSSRKDNYRRAPDYKYSVKKATMPVYIDHKTKVELEKAGVDLVQFERRR